MSRITRKNNQLRYLPKSNYIEEAEIQSLMYRGIATTIVMIIIFIVYASIIEIDQIASVGGEIEPKQPIYKINHLDGGVIQSVKVHSQQKVRKGQLLLTFQSTRTKADLLQMQQRQLSLLIAIERWHAFIENKPFSRSETIKRLIKRLSTKDSKENKLLEKSLMNDKVLVRSMHHLLAEQVLILESKRAAKKVMVQREEFKLLLHEEKIRLYNDELDIYDKLRGKAFVSELELMKVKQRLIDAKVSKVEVTHQLKIYQEELREQNYRLQELRLKKREEAHQIIAELQSSLMEVHENIQKLKDRVDHLVVRAPIDGIIKGLDLHPGSVISKNQRLLEIVPEKQVLLVKVQIPPKDIGYVKVGNHVKVKITAYDFSQYGSIPGRLVDLSADTFVHENGDQYYVGTVEIEQQTISEKSGRAYQFRPGMLAEVDIITGKRSLLWYLLKPIHRNVSQSFKEK